MAGFKLSEKTLKRLAGTRVFERGVAYYGNDAITTLHVAGKRVYAEVEGTYPYEVELSFDKGFDYYCSCPMGESGDCCKHIVAVGLAVMEESPDFDAETQEQQRLETYLASLPKDELVKIVLAQADNDPALHNRLTLQAAGQGAQLDIAALKKQIKQAFAARGFVDYSRMRGLVLRVSAVVDELEILLEKVFAAQVVELTQYALEQGIKTYQNTDDSGGGFGWELQRLSEIHLHACQQSGPEPKALARALFKLIMKEDWGIITLSDYTPILGEQGMKQLRQLAGKEWAKVPARTERDDRFSSGHYNITKLMEAIAIEDGDIDGLVAIRARDLSSAYRYLTIAQLLDEHKRYDEALGWAERGQRRFSNDMDSRLVDYLVQRYKKLKRPNDAIELTWDQYQQSPTLESYKTLKKTVGRRTGAARWREKALQYAYEQRAKETNKRRGAYGYFFSRRGLPIEILLFEKRVTEAIEEFRQHGCPESLTGQLARACEKAHPEVAVEIYRPRVEQAINLTSNDAYHRAVDLIETVQPLMKRLKKERHFDAWLEKLKTDYRAKRNFIKFLSEWEQRRKKRK